MGHRGQIFGGAMLFSSEPSIQLCRAKHFVALFFLSYPFLMYNILQKLLIWNSIGLFRLAHNQVQKKTIRMLFIVVLLFGLCWLPYHIVILHSEFSKSVAGANHHLMAFCQWLMFANSACNPVVYAVLNKNYRRQFTMILYRRMQSVQVHAAPVENPEWLLLFSWNFMQVFCMKYKLQTTGPCRKLELLAEILAIKSIPYSFLFY